MAGRLILIMNPFRAADVFSGSRFVLRSTIPATKQKSSNIVLAIDATAALGHVGN